MSCLLQITHFLLDAQPPPLHHLHPPPSSSSGPAHSFHHRTPSRTYHHHVPIHWGEINTFTETMQLWLHVNVLGWGGRGCAFIFLFRTERNSWLLSFFRKQRAGEKMLFLLAFFPSSSSQPQDFATFWPQSHSSEILALGEGCVCVQSLETYQTEIKGDDFWDC